MKLVLIVLLCSCMNQGAAFYDKVLDDYGLHSAFIAIDVQSGGYTGRTVIENAKLYYFFNQTRGYDKADYMKFMKERLLNKDRISLGDVSLKKWRFFKVVAISSVEDHASKGLDKFIDHYFKGKVIKEGIGVAETNAVISKLFDFGVRAKVDDGTGILVIAR
jgi:hypothetical protein